MPGRECKALGNLERQGDSALAGRLGRSHRSRLAVVAADRDQTFWWTADDKFFNYALASKLGAAIPSTVILPHNKHPEGTTDQSMRNLIYPLNWDEIFSYVGFPAFLKPYSGGGWKHVYNVHSPEEFLDRKSVV